MKMILIVLKFRSMIRVFCRLLLSMTKLLSLPLINHPKDWKPLTLSLGILKDTWLVTTIPHIRKLFSSGPSKHCLCISFRYSNWPFSMRFPHQYYLSRLFLICESTKYKNSEHWEFRLFTWLQKIVYILNTDKKRVLRIILPCTDYISVLLKHRVVP
jgi:hypothetical protein